MSRSLGIPVKLLHEVSGHIVTVELKSGELYGGSMIECKDNWNCQLENISFTSKKNQVYGHTRYAEESRIKGKGSALGVGCGRAVAMQTTAQAVGQGAPSVRGHCPPVRR